MLKGAERAHPIATANSHIDLDSLLQRDYATHTEATTHAEIAYKKLCSNEVQQELSMLTQIPTHFI